MTKKKRWRKRAFEEKVDWFDFFATIAELLLLLPRAVWQFLK